MAASEERSLILAQAPGIPTEKATVLADESEPLEHLIIDRETSEAILEHARLKQVGINELALGLLFETCCIWNQQHGDRNPRSRIRILMPYDLRSRIDLRMPATNRLSFSFLGRRQDQCGDLNDSLDPSTQKFNA